MSNIKIVLNRQGVAELMKSAEMQAICKEYADGIAERAEGNYEVTTNVGKNRCSASVITTDWATFKKNLNSNDLLKGMYK